MTFKLIADLADTQLRKEEKMNKKLALSDRDKKNSAKKKQKVVLKNLLAQPFERYW